MTAILGRTGNLVGFTTGRGTTPWNTEMEGALRKIDAMLASTVIAITNTLPGSANEGDLYLVGTLPTGIAAGWANRIARWRSSPAGWEAYQPMQGWIITIVGEATNKVRRYNGTAWVAIAVDSGAEPYAGVPAQTSFWRSTAAGVRAWVQLVAADITDLAATLAAYLTKADPTFTGTLTGPVVRAEGDWSSVNGQAVVGRSGQAGYYSMRRGSDGSQTGGIGWMASATESSEFRHSAVGGGSYQTFLNNGVERLRIANNGALLQSGTTFLDASRNIIGTTLKGVNLTGAGNRPLVAGADGTIGVLVAATTGNPHGTTAADVGALAEANPNFTGSLLQDGDQRITPSGGGRFTDLSLTTLAAGSDLPMVSDEAGVLRNKTAGEFRTIIAAAPAAHNHFSKLDVSASTTIGSIDDTSIKVTTTDVILTLSGGVDGQGWDIINPTTSTGIAIPSGATLWKSIGSNVGPTTIALGGGRPIRITRIDANTWTMLGSQ